MTIQPGRPFRKLALAPPLILVLALAAQPALPSAGGALAQDDELPPGWSRSEFSGGAIYGLASMDEPENSRTAGFETEDDQQVYAAGNLTFRADRAETWTRVEKAPLHVHHLTSNRRGVLFAVDEVGDRYRSENYGRSWSSIDVEDEARVRFVAVSDEYADDDQAYAISVEDWRLFRYDRRSNRWIEVAFETGVRHEVGGAAFSPQFATDETIIAGAADGIYRSLDSGQTWSRIATPEDGAPRFGQAAGSIDEQGLILSEDFGDDFDKRDDIDDGSVFAYNKDGLYLSRDKGETWRRLPLEAQQIRGLAVSNGWPADPVILVAVSDPGHVGAFSKDGGETWSWIDGSPSLSGTAAAMARDFGVPGFDVQYHPATISWVYAPFILKMDPDQEPYRFPIPRYRGSREMYLATDGDGVWRIRLKDGARQPGQPPAYDAIVELDRDITRPSLRSVRPKAVLVLPGSGGQEAIVGTYASGLYHSADGGETWAWIENGPDRGDGQVIHQILASPNFAQDGSIFLAAESGIWVSRDRGRSWSKAAGPAPARSLAISANFASDGLMLSSGQISSDGGRSWTNVGGGAAGFPWTAAAISPRFAEDQRLWVARYIAEEDRRENPDSLYMSEDGGQSWEVQDISRLRRKLVHDIEVMAISIDPLRIFLGTDSGLIYTEDEGEDWDAVSGTGGEEIFHLEAQLVEQPFTTGIVVGAGEDELYWSTTRGRSWESSPRDIEGLTSVSLFDGGLGALTTDLNGVYRFEGLFDPEQPLLAEPDPIGRARSW